MREDNIDDDDDNNNNINNNTNNNFFQPSEREKEKFSVGSTVCLSVSVSESPSKSWLDNGKQTSNFYL